MKKLYHLFFSPGLLAFVMAGSLLAFVAAGCKKNIPTATYHSPGAVSGFTASASTVVLSSANDSSTVLTLSWKAPDYGFSAAATYSLLIDQPSDTSGATAWANAVKVAIPTGSLQKSWLGMDLNQLLNQLGLPEGAASPIVIRLKADVNQTTGLASSIPSLYSDIAMTVTPYKALLVYPKYYVAGDFLVPNWTQKDQAGWILASAGRNSTYEGYVWFPNKDNAFKLCSQLDWNGTNYGWGGSLTTISSDGGAGNCYFSGPGYCRVTTDLDAKTISYVPVNWFVAGDFNGWSTTAALMTFNSSTNQWTVSGVQMTAGDKFKFAGDNNWNSSYGVDDKGNLKFNGGDIIAAKTGTFTVTLDLSAGAGNYTYSVK